MYLSCHFLPKRNEYCPLDAQVKSYPQLMPVSCLALSTNRELVFYLNNNTEKNINNGSMEIFKVFGFNFTPHPQTNSWGLFAKMMNFWTLKDVGQTKMGSTSDLRFKLPVERPLLPIVQQHCCRTFEQISMNTDLYPLQISNKQNSAGGGIVTRHVRGCEGGADVKSNKLQTHRKVNNVRSRFFSSPLLSSRP